MIAGPYTVEERARLYLDQGMLTAQQATAMFVVVGEDIPEDIWDAARLESIGGGR